MTPTEPRRMMALLVFLIVLLLTWLSVEGVWSLAGGQRARFSIMARGFQLLTERERERERERESSRPGSGPPGRTGAEQDAAQAVGASRPALLRDQDVLVSYLDDMRRAEVLLGNSPYRHELATPEARFTYDDPVTGTLRMKPHLQARMAFMHTTLFDPLNPLVYVAHADADLSPRLDAFLRRYQLHPTTFSTTAHGERISAVDVSRNGADVILVAGDSVVFGVLVDDDEHLPARLNRHITCCRFVNLGIPGGSLVDSAIVIREAATRYGPAVAGIVYVHFENDFTLSEQPDPDAIVRRLLDLASGAGVAAHDVVFVSHRYIYRTIPEVFRQNGAELDEWDRVEADLLTHAHRTGFRTIRTQDLIDRVRDATGSLLAPAALYLDHGHLSPPAIDDLALMIAGIDPWP